MKFLNYAYILARDVSPFAGARVAAILVYKNKIISIGVNSSKSHPITRLFGKNRRAIYPHAEVNCLHNADRRGFNQWHKAQLYVARAKKVKGIDVFGLSKPCPGCCKAIEHYGIGRVFWTADYEFK